MLPDQIIDLCSANGPANVITLAVDLRHRSCPGKLRCGLNTLNNDLLAEALSKSNKRFQHNRCLRTFRNIVNQGPVYFQHIDCESMQSGQRPVSGAEVVNRDSNACCTYRIDGSCKHNERAGLSGFCELDLQLCCIDSVRGQQSDDFIR